MRARASKDGLTLRVIAGSSNVLLAMDLEETKRQGCLGFTIERTDLDSGERRWLPNMLRFDSDPLDAAISRRPPSRASGTRRKRNRPGRKPPGS